MKSALTLWPSQEYHEVNETALIPTIAEVPLPLSSKIIDLNVFFDTIDNGINGAMFNKCHLQRAHYPKLVDGAEHG